MQVSGLCPAATPSRDVHQGMTQEKEIRKASKQESWQRISQVSERGTGGDKASGGGGRPRTCLQDEARGVASPAVPPSCTSGGVTI